MIRRDKENFSTPKWCYSIKTCVHYFKDGSCNCPSAVWCNLLDVFISKPRKCVIILVYLKCLLGLADLIWAVLGSVLLIQDYTCEKLDVESKLKIFTGYFWFLFLIRAILIWLVFDDTEVDEAAIKYVKSEWFPLPLHESVIKTWQRRLRTLYCCIGSSEEKELAIIGASQIMSSLTQGFDFTTSDVIAALKLYRREDLAKYEETEIALETTPSIVLQDGSAIDKFPTSDFPSWMNLKLASRYYSICLGTYGAPWVLYRNLLCGLCVMWKFLRCSICCRTCPVEVIGDNCCGSNLSGLLATTKLRYDDLVYVSFSNQMYESPFFVAVDNSTSSVVISIRGNMSLYDSLSVSFGPFNPLDDEDVPKGILCHAGAYLAALKIKAKLERFQILQKAFTRRNGYHLVLTGHSLGAGVASILTLLLRKSYPDIRCFAFSVLPVFNEAALAATKDCIFSIIAGNDIVPYLNAYHLREMVIRCYKLLSECNLPKHKVLMNRMDLAKKTTKIDDADGMAMSRVIGDSESGEEFTENDRIFPKEETEFCNMPLNSKVKNFEQLKAFIPGRILHIRFSKFGYRLRVCDAQDFDSLSFFPGMMHHHLPQVMKNCLEQLGEIEFVKLSTNV